MEKWIAITGCNGYIGGQTVLKFKDAGYKILGADRNNLLSPWMREYVDLLIPGDFTSGLFRSAVVAKNPSALIHIAGTSLVGPSISDPADYYMNNVGNTARLMKSLAEAGWNRTFIFSSSAAVYGVSDNSKILYETSITNPNNPYGQSKLMAEQVIKDCSAAYGFKSVAFRYFNAAGADSRVRHGQMKKATHIIARLIEAVINRSVFTLNGKHYDTPDGTCIRDYLHVEDIADAHFNAVSICDDLRESFFESYNLGTGKGYSNQEIINAVEKITGKSILVHVGPNRIGDPAMLVAGYRKFKNWSSWEPRNSQLDNIIRTGWAWYNSQCYQNFA